MPTNAYSDGNSRARTRARVWWNTAALAVILSTLVALGGLVAAVLPGTDAGIGMRLTSGVLAVVGGAGVWAAVCGHGRRDSKLMALAFACALGSSAVLAAVRGAG